MNPALCRQAQSSTGLKLATSAWEVGVVARRLKPTGASVCWQGVEEWGYLLHLNTVPARYPYNKRVRRYVRNVNPVWQGDSWVFLKGMFYKTLTHTEFIETIGPAVFKIQKVIGPKLRALQCDTTCF